MFKRIVLFGDSFGIPQLIEAIPNSLIKCIVISSVRPQYFKELNRIATKYNLPVLIQPKYNSSEYNNFVEQFSNFKFDMLICNSYSMLIRREILENVKHNALNTHWGLLPKNRGPNPTQWAIIKGEKETGVTIHYMDNGFDSGDIIAQTKEPIRENDTWISLNKRLEKISCDLLKKNVHLIIEGKTERTRQDETKATHNKRLTQDSPLIDFKTMNDMQIFNLIRAQVFPLKGAFVIEKMEERVYFTKYLSLDDVKKMRKKYGK